jgi:hypothetical protein
MEIVLTTGGDDLRSDSAAEAIVRLHNGATFTVPLKQGSVGAQQGLEWNNGAMVSQSFSLPQYTSKLPTLEDGIDSVTIRMFESGHESGWDDNWDISGLQVRLAANPGGDILEDCQFDLADANPLQDGSTGLVRLSASSGGSGVGPEVTFATPAAAAIGGLPQPVYPVFLGTGENNSTPTGEPVQPGAPLPPGAPGIQFIFDTGNDNVRQDSGIIVYLYNSPSAPTQYYSYQLKNSGDPEWKNDTEQDFVLELPNNGEVPDHMDLHLQQHNSGTETDDKWDVNGVNIVTWQANGPEVCYYRNYQNSGQAANSGDDGAVFTVQDNYITFSLENCRSVAASP